MKNLNLKKHEQHPFHLVDPSPWPIITLVVWLVLFQLTVVSFWILLSTNECVTIKTVEGFTFYSYLVVTSFLQVGVLLIIRLITLRLDAPWLLTKLVHGIMLYLTSMVYLSHTKLVKFLFGVYVLQEETLVKTRYYSVDLRYSAEQRYSLLLDKYNSLDKGNETLSTLESILPYLRALSTEDKPLAEMQVDLLLYLVQQAQPVVVPTVVEEVLMTEGEQAFAALVLIMAAAVAVALMHLTGRVMLLEHRGKRATANIRHLSEEAGATRQEVIRLNADLCELAKSPVVLKAGEAIAKFTE